MILHLVETAALNARCAAYTNLQAAIDAAKDGDVITVGEGNWGKIVCDNKLIDIIATGDRGKTFLSGGATGRAATLTQRPRGEMDFETNTLVRGFTIQNGDFANEAFRPKYGGGAIGGTFVDCRFVNNKGRYGGGAAYANCYNCVFTGNKANLGGGAVSLCNVQGSLLENNAADFDGGAAEWSQLEDCIVKGNKAGRLGGGVCNGSAVRCRIMNNRSEGEGGGAFRASVRNCIVARNSAKKYGGGIAGGASFSTIMFNTVDSDQPGSGFTSGSSCCLVGYNVSKGNTNAFQVAGYHNRYGSGNWYASANTYTNDHPKGDWRNPVGTFTKAAFVDADHDNYRLSSKAPFINAATDQVASHDALDVYGMPRVSGGALDVGAAEYQGGKLVAVDFDASKSNPLASTAVRGPIVRGADRQPWPSYKNGAIVFDGTCAAFTDPLSNYGIGSAQYGRTRYEISFRTQTPGPVLSTGATVVRVVPSGKLNVTTIFQNSTNVMESAGAVVGPNFNTLVIDVDKFGTCDTVLSATLNGAKLPVVQSFKWDGVKPFGIGSDQQRLGGAGEEFFKGEIKSFKVSAFAD